MFTTDLPFENREALQQLAEQMIVVAAAFCDFPAGILARDGLSVRWFSCRQLLGAEQCRVTVTPAHNKRCRVMRAQQERKMAENPPPPPPTDEGQPPPPVKPSNNLCLKLPLFSFQTIE